MESAGLTTPVQGTSPGISVIPAKMALTGAIDCLDLASSLISWDLLRLQEIATGSRIWLMSPQIAPPTTVGPSAMPKTDPSPGLFVDISIGVTVAMIVAGILLHNHRSRNSDFIIHDTGWQFQMKLATPLSLDISRIGTKNP
jgi:hypothetical protein